MLEIRGLWGLNQLCVSRTEKGIGLYVTSDCERSDLQLAVKKAFIQAGVRFKRTPTETIPEVPLRIVNTSLKYAVQIIAPPQSEVDVVTQLLKKVAGTTALPEDVSLVSAKEFSLVSAITSIGDSRTASWLKHVFAKPAL